MTANRPQKVTDLARCPLCLEMGKPQAAIQIHTLRTGHIPKHYNPNEMPKVQKLVDRRKDDAKARLHNLLRKGPHSRILDSFHGKT
jgi:hypothetical protein